MPLKRHAGVFLFAAALILTPATASSIEPETHGVTLAPEKSEFIRIGYILEEGDEAALLEAAEQHRSMCRQTAALQCTVQSIRLPSDRDERVNGKLDLVMATASVDRFVADVMKAEGRPGLTLNVAKQPRTGTDSRTEPELLVTFQALQAQKSRLEELSNSQDGDIAVAAGRILSNVDQQIISITKQLEAKPEDAQVTRVTIDYSISEDYRRSWWQDELGQVVEFFLLSILAVIGVALLTVIYFGVIGFTFVRFRRLARKLGWGKSLAGDGDDATPVEPAAPPRS